MSDVRLTALTGLPEIPPGDDLAARLARLVPPGPGILVVAQKIVSKAEGRLVRLSDIEPSPRALELARELGKEPRHTELVLRESRRYVAEPPATTGEVRHAPRSTPPVRRPGSSPSPTSSTPSAPRS